jgi:hypothetical protein
MEGSRRESRKGWEELPTPRAGGAGVYGDAETGLRWEGVFPVFRTGG